MTSFLLLYRNKFRFVVWDFYYRIGVEAALLCLSFFFLFTEVYWGRECGTFCNLGRNMRGHFFEADIHLIHFNLVPWHQNANWNSSTYSVLMRLSWQQGRAEISFDICIVEEKCKGGNEENRLLGRDRNNFMTQTLQREKHLAGSDVTISASQRQKFRLIYVSINMVSSINTA